MEGWVLFYWQWLVPPITNDQSRKSEGERQSKRMKDPFLLWAKERERERYRYVKKVKGWVAWSRVVSYNAESRNLSFDFFDISLVCRVGTRHRVRANSGCPFSADGPTVKPPSIKLPIELGWVRPITSFEVAPQFCRWNAFFGELRLAVILCDSIDSFLNTISLKSLYRDRLNNGP